jgi:hypothetical protein
MLRNLSQGRCCRVCCWIIGLGIAAVGAPAPAIAGGTSWAEDTDSPRDGVIDTIYHDEDNDGNPEFGAVLDANGRRVSEWEDTDDDGHWDRCRHVNEGDVLGEWRDLEEGEEGPRPITPHDNVMGDLNGDHLVNNFDIDAFVFALTATPLQFQQRYPQANLYSADVNGDTYVDNFDIQTFVECIAHGGCGTPTPATGACCVRQNNVITCVPGVTQQQCAQMQGFYRGDGSACSAVACRQ